MATGRRVVMAKRELPGPRESVPRSVNRLGYSWLESAWTILTRGPLLQPVLPDHNDGRSRAHRGQRFDVFAVLGIRRRA